VSGGHDEDRLGKAFREAGGGEAPPDPCPGEERIWAARAGELPARDRHDVIDHLSRCRDCAEAWRLADELQRAHADTDVVQRARPGLFRLPRPAMLAAAAAILVATGAGVLFLDPGRWWRSDATYREGRALEIRALVGEKDPLPRERFVLLWEGAPPGSRFDVVVTTGDLEPVAEARGLVTPSLHVSPTALAAVAGGGRVLWRVEATLPDGSRIASATFVARVR